MAARGPMNVTLQSAGDTFATKQPDMVLISTASKTTVRENKTLEFRSKNRQPRTHMGVISLYT